MEAALRWGRGGMMPTSWPSPTLGRGASFSLWIIQPQLNNMSEPQGLGPTSSGQGTVRMSGGGVSREATLSMLPYFGAARRPGLGPGRWAQIRGRKWIAAGPGGGTGSGLVGHLFLTS